MSKRKVHLRPNAVIQLGHTKTRCGVGIWPRPNREGHYETSGAVVTFRTQTIVRRLGKLHEVNADVTVHGTLVTCAKCLNKMRGIGIG